MADDRVITDPGILLYTRVKKSPYYYGSRRHGVHLYSVYNHHYHPRHYGDPVAEYYQLLEGVTLWDVGGAERQVEITGPDAFRFTNLLTPRDLNKCAVGQCKYAFITDERGGIINDPVLLRLEENRFWLSLRRHRRAAVGQGRRLQRRHERRDLRARRGPDADPGAEVQGGHDRPLRGRHPRRPLLLHGHQAARRDGAGDLAHGLLRRARLRALPDQRQPRRPEALGRGHPGRRAARPEPDRAVPHPPHRGRHPRPRL